MTPAGSKVIAGFDVVTEVEGGRGHLPCNVPNWALEPCAISLIGSQVDGHGTATASAAAGNRVGVAPGASLVSIRAFTTFGMSVAVLMRALSKIIEHAWDPATPQFNTGIVSMSVGVNDLDTVPAEVETKIRQMTAGVDRNGNPDPNGKRFLFTFFGGNVAGRHCDPSGGPRVVPTLLGGQIKGAINVGGLTKSNDLWSGSCHGGGMEVLAPADDVLVASFTGHDHYRPRGFYSNGTSYAAPLVAGIAARMLQQNPNLTPEQLEDLIESSPSSANGGERVAVFVPPLPAGRHRAASH